MTKISILDVETGKTTERAMTAAELKQWEQDQADMTATIAKQAEDEAAKVVAKAAAEAKLALLGLTSDDLKALGL